MTIDMFEDEKYCVLYELFDAGSDGKTLSLEMQF